MGTSAGVESPTAAPAGRDGPRVVGLDLARAIALLGMVATHTVLLRTAEGDVTALRPVAAGNASALFAVLLGVSVALVSGRRVPVAGRERLACSAGLAVRGLLIGLVGLVLGEAGSGLAVILTYYGLLYLLALPFLGLRVRSLAALAVTTAAVVPVLSHALRPALPQRGLASPHLDQLTEPWHLLSELLLTGYYPALPWLAYLLAGMALGRSDLRSLRTVTVLLLSGAGLALLARSASALLVGPAVLGRLAADPAAAGVPGLPTGDPVALRGALEAGLYGATPAGGSWEWLLVAAPHSGTPFDLAGTAGVALLVIGLALLVDRLPGTARETVAILAGAGRMTLTLYSLHVLMRSPLLPPAEGPDGFGAHVAVLVLIGFVFAAAERRGPLEAAVAGMSRRAAALVRGRGAQAPVSSDWPGSSGPGPSGPGSSGPGSSG